MTVTHALIPGRWVAVRARRPAIHLLRRALDAALVTVIAVVLGTGLATRLAPLIGWEALVIRGGSMEPAIGLGSLAFVDTDDPTLAAGDVIAYRAGQAVVTHRVLSVDTSGTEPRYVTQGDANPSRDAQPVEAAAIVGRVELTLPMLGYLAWMIGTILGLTAIVCTVGTLLVSAWMLEELEWHTTRRVVSAPPPG